MEIITKNNRKYYRFKIGDEFSAISGKGSFNKMKKEGLCSDTYNEEQGFIYPCLDASSSNNHIKGYCKEYNNKEKSIKVVKDGAGAGKSCFFDRKVYVTGGAYLLTSTTFSNSYLSLFLQNYLPNFNKGTTIPHCNFSDYKDEYIEIPINHKELSQVIKRILEYKQISKQISKQMKDYKLAILQESEKAIKHWKETNQHDKYITFKIGDEFKCTSYNTLISNLHTKIKSEIKLVKTPTYNSLKKIGIVGNKDKNYKYKFISRGLLSNTWSKYKNIGGTYITFSEVGGDMYLFKNEECFIGKGVSILESNHYVNEYLELYLNSWIKQFNQSSVVSNYSFTKIKDEGISIPSNHEELSKKIEQLNKWQIKVEETVKQMEEYIEGILQMSLK